jgi:dTDP-4-amino-4,6-dideoxygalactose transaminase
MSLETFNQDRDAMIDAVDGRTLAVMPVHMFGLPDDLRGLEETAREKGAFVVEDGASAMGSRVGDRQVGSMGDVSFFSFNRGKNLSTVTGGAVLTDRTDIFEAVTEEVDRLESPNGTAGARIHLLVKALGLSLIWRPAAYTILSPVAGAYRYRGLHDRIELYTYTEYQAGIGCSLIDRADEIFTARHRKGTMLRDMLGECRHLRIPELVSGAHAVYNQFPLIMPGKARRPLLVELLRAGIEATTLYPRPIHRVYDLGLPENPDPCPAATVMADGILLIPVHPGVRYSDVCRVAEIVRDGKWAERT